MQRSYKLLRIIIFCTHELNMLNGVENIISNIIKELKRGNILFCPPGSDDFRKYSFLCGEKIDRARY